jgi:uncharacterized membrane protein (DUF4010 family)
LIAGVSFVGYIAIRLMGDQTGIVVASIAGGVTSSTATTLSFARLARDHPEASSLLAGGILIAGVTMVIRVVAIAAALAPSLLAELLLPGLAAATVLAAAGGLLVFGQNNSEAGRSVLRLKNPFELASALKLASLIAIIMLLAKLVSAKIGAQGVFLLAAASGVADVDALTLSMARFADSQFTISDAATAILIAACTNTAAKAVMAGCIGGRRMAIAVGFPSGIAILALAAAPSCCNVGEKTEPVAQVEHFVWQLPPLLLRCPFHVQSREPLSANA